MLIYGNGPVVQVEKDDGCVYVSNKLYKVDQVMLGQWVAGFLDTESLTMRNTSAITPLDVTKVKNDTVMIKIAGILQLDDIFHPHLGRIPFGRFRDRLLGNFAVGDRLEKIPSPHVKHPASTIVRDINSPLSETPSTDEDSNFKPEGIKNDRVPRTNTNGTPVIYRNSKHSVFQHSNLEGQNEIFTEMKPSANSLFSIFHRKDRIAQFNNNQSQQTTRAPFNHHNSTRMDSFEKNFKKSNTKKEDSQRRNISHKNIRKKIGDDESADEQGSQSIFMDVSNPTLKFDIDHQNTLDYKKFDGGDERYGNQDVKNDAKNLVQSSSKPQTGPTMVYSREPKDPLTLYESKNFRCKSTTEQTVCEGNDVIRKEGTQKQNKIIKDRYTDQSSSKLFSNPNTSHNTPPRHTGFRNSDELDNSGQDFHRNRNPKTGDERNKGDIQNVTKNDFSSRVSDDVLRHSDGYDSLKNKDNENPEINSKSSEIHKKYNLLFFKDTASSDDVQAELNRLNPSDLQDKETYRKQEHMTAIEHSNSLVASELRHNEGVTRDLNGCIIRFSVGQEKTQKLPSHWYPPAPPRPEGYESSSEEYLTESED